MEFHEYLELCTGQMRCKAMRPVVERELRNHLEEQKEAYLADGIEEKEAEAMAVRDMGDPVEAGTGLDRVHRPRMDWKTVGMILLLALLGILIQFILAQDGFTAETFPRFCRNTFLGIGVMLAVCFVDYTVIGKYPRLIWLILMGAGILIGRFTLQMNGVRNTVWFVMLLVPAFAGIVFYYRTQKWRGIGKVLAWLALSYMVARSMDLVVRGQILLLGGILILGYAVAKGWYGIRKIWALAIFGLPVAGMIPLTICALAADGFQARRLRAWLNPGMALNGAGYFPARILQEMDKMSLFVHKKELAEDAAFWVSNSENYTLLLLARWYGVVVVLVILALLAILAGMLVFTLRRQKNRLGVLVGAGCIWVLSVMVLIHTLVNFGLLPATDCSLPFFSANGKEGLVIYGLMGILLSVFRTTATLPEPKAQKNLFGWKLELVRTKQ